MTSLASPATPSTASPRLVGRQRARGELRAALAAALSGRGGLVLIGGEAGIGKTALAEALCDEASEQGRLVLVGCCRDLAETPPYGPWAELLAVAPAAGHLPSPPDLGGPAVHAGPTAQRRTWHGRAGAARSPGRAIAAGGRGLAAARPAGPGDL